MTSSHREFHFMVLHQPWRHARLSFLHKFTVTEEAIDTQIILWQVKCPFKSLYTYWVITVSALLH